MEEEDQRKNKYEQKQLGDNEERLKGLETCEVFVCLLLGFDMDHINNPKVKDLRVLLCFQFGSKN